MTLRARPSPAAPCLALIAVLLGTMLVACTHQPALPRASDTADSFIGALEHRDGAAMISSFAHGSRLRSKPARVERLIHQVLRGGDIKRFKIERTGPVPQPPDDEIRQSKTPAVAHAPYRITYWSDAVPAPVVLRGQLPLLFQGGRWGVRWNKGILLPGIRGAAAFHVSYRWPKRAAILDRHGNPLAVGPASSRRYPFHTVGGASVGHLAPLSAAEVGGSAAGHRPGDLVGASGLEQALEDRLAGTPADRLQILGHHHHVLRTLGRVAAHRGHDVKTTLDVNVQRAAEAGDGSATGGAVVMDPRTGDILAIVSSSPFDPTNYLGVPGIQPFNRALSGLYPPGSSMKVVTASAALDTGTVTASTRLSGPKEFRGVRNFESESFRSLSFAQALEFSVNTAFAQVALKLGARKLHRYANLFGFNKVPSLPLATARSSFPFPRDESDLMWGAVGQAQDLATPLEMATVAATIADHGKRMEPRITLKAPTRGTRVVSRATAATMTQLMELVVQGGTGTAAAIPGIAVAGKTGTAEVDVNGVRKNHAWFVCFAPAANPKVAVSVVVEYGGVGGVVAAPLARSILERVLPLVP
ncbi:MAG: penicillin-binding protein 2 [Actinomycetota bacterium]|nr:penicillin-binding protein 2 [Actinomycetota bacterium]